MNITTISGHITAIEKKHLSAMLQTKWINDDIINNGEAKCKVNTKNYLIEMVDNFVYSASIVTSNKDYSCGFDTHKITFKIS